MNREIYDGTRRLGEIVPADGRSLGEHNREADAMQAVTAQRGHVTAQDIARLGRDNG